MAASDVLASVNPVLRREMVERMRGGRAFVILTAYLALLSLVLYGAYEVGRGTDDPMQTAQVGRGIFGWLLFFMLLLVLFLVPAQAASAIAGERERQTLVPLQVTLLSPQQILLGKIYAAVAFLLLLVVATMPLLSVSYLVGGVTMGEVLGGVAVVLFVGLAVGCMCAAISVFARRVQAATVMSYGLVLLLTLGTFAVWGAYSKVDGSRGVDSADPPSWLLLPNPLATVAGVVGNGRDANGGSNDSPFDGVEDLIVPESFNQVTGEPTGDAASGPPASFLWGSIGLLAALAALAVGLGARRLRTPALTER
jgi:ABC-2 type transport system permease protein